MSSPSAIALITGMHFEKVVADKAVAGSGIKTYIAGPGAKNGRQAVQQAARYGAKLIVSFGVCGGLDPDLKCGNVIIPRKILLDEGATSITTDEASVSMLSQLVEQQFYVKNGDMLCTGKAVTQTGDKARLFNATKAVAVDMESGFLALEAERVNLPFAVMRVVHDTADQPIPPALASISNDDGQINPFGLIIALIRHWPGLAVLKRLANNDAIARDIMASLARILSGNDDKK